ncbi:MAG: DUF2335 domain-containing protein [Tabrizicola sp.]|nr:DUF2335 domain-containing protein [Tabrizicola sp.]
MKKLAKSPPRPPAKTSYGTAGQDSDGASLPSLEEEIDRQIGDLVPQGARSQVVARITTLMVSEHFSGPIAHPRHLREYEDICPGSADRIISMAEHRNQHNMDMDRTSLAESVKDQKLGMVMGGGLFALLVSAALVVALKTESVLLAGLFLGAAAVGVIGLFIRGRNGKN